MDRQMIIIAAVVAYCVIALIIAKYLGLDEDGDDKGFPHSRGRRK